MLCSRSRVLLAVSSLLLVLPETAEAQIVRRFAGGGVQIRAPFVRVNVGPGGATSVRAPFTAVDNPGGTYVGRRRRLMAQPQYAAPSPGVAPNIQNTAQPTPAELDSVDVDALPYPTVSQLTAMDDQALVETTRQMMARFNYRLTRLKTGKGWQDYLVLSRDLLGAPGAPAEAVRLDAVRDMLPRYQSVADDPQFVKISALPSFVATFAALQEVDRRFAGPESSGPEITEPLDIYPGPATTPRAESQPQDEILPTPQPSEVPNASRGERSILKRR